MDISSLLSTVMSQDSLGSISQAAGVSPEQAQSILSSALPSLLNGAVSQSEDSATAEGFAGALNQHSASDVSDLSAFLKGVDLQDGAKIVAHLLGSDTAAVTDAAARKAGASADGSANVLAAAAPLLMSLLGKETNSQQSQSSGSNAAVAAIMGALIKNADMGSILSGLLGGGSAKAEAEQEAEKEEEKKPGGILGAITSLLK